jgi:hypothetical protein
MTQSLTECSQYSKEELDKLRASYLQQNKTCFSFPSVARILFQVLVGCALIVAIAVCVESLFANIVSERALKNIINLILPGGCGWLMIWVTLLDDRKRFNAFLLKHKAESGRQEILNSAPTEHKNLTPY